MTGQRRAAAILTAALTLGVAGPAAARPIDSVGPYSQQPPAGDHAVSTSSGGSSDLEYLLIGAGGIAVMVGGAAVATRRRHHARPNIAA
jgi:hypothetical protein